MKKKLKTIHLSQNTCNPSKPKLTTLLFLVTSSFSFNRVTMRKWQPALRPGWTNVFWLMDLPVLVRLMVYFFYTSSCTRVPRIKKRKRPQCLKKNNRLKVPSDLTTHVIDCFPKRNIFLSLGFCILGRDMTSLKRLSSKGPLNEGCFIHREVKLNCWLCSHNRLCQMFLFFSLTQQVTWWVRICSTHSSCTHGTSSFLPGTMRCRTSSTQTYQPLASQSVTTHR